jgi:uncharacterized protein (DUF2384 family)
VFWDEAERLLDALDHASIELAASPAVSDNVAGVVRRLVEVIGPMSPEEFGAADPYLVEMLLAGMVAASGAMWLGDAEKRRRELRVPLERARQALRDLIAERDVALDRPAKEIARWLDDVSGVPQSQLAELLNVGARTFQRWVSPTESSSPSGADETRLRVLARTVDQLRWSMTSSGVVRWLGRPHPELGGRRPADLLDEPTAYRDLPRLAASTRAMTAT